MFTVTVLVFTLQLFLGGVSAASVKVGLPRGVAAADAQVYDSAAGVFSCGAPDAGSTTPKTLLFSYVNDDFCDCPDGSDEPGTSACAGTTTSALRPISFFCKNEAFEGRRVAVSRVSDGICDCCDGTDESAGVCADTCAALAEQSRDANRAQREAFEAGAKQRARWLVAAKESLAEQRSELDQARKVLVAAAASQQGLEQQAGSLNQQETTEKISRRVAAQKDAEVRLGLHRLAQPRLLELVVRLVRDAGEGEAITARVLALAEELSNIDCNATAVGCEPAVLKNDAEEERQVLRDASEAAAQAEAVLASAGPAARMDGDAAATPASDDEDEEELQLEGPSSPDSAVVATAEQDGEHAASEQIADAAEKPAAVVPEDPETARRQRLRQRLVRSFEDAERYVLPEAAALRDKMAQLKDSVDKMKNAVREKEGLLDGVDYGPEGVWFAVRDACYKTQMHGYTWELCPLKQMKQDATSLGKFKQWDNNYSTMVFEGGQRCWNGPERSAEIQLECGATSELVSMEEPSKCVYKGRFLTPLLCV
jgi:protein kinase C substrate 80K-H